LSFKEEVKIGHRIKAIKKLISLKNYEKSY